MGTPAMAHQTQFGMADTGSAIDEFYAVESMGIRKTETHIEMEGARGIVDHIADNVGEGTYTVGGPVVFVPTPADYDNLLPKILGGSENADVFPLAQTIPDFVAQADLVTKVPAFSGCKINRARFFSSRGQPLRLEADIQGKKFGAYSGTTFTEGDPGAAGSFPAATYSLLNPYYHYELTLTIGGTTYACDNWELVVDNVLLLDRFLNSQTRTELPNTDRIITMSADFPYTTDEDELFNIATAGLAATAVFTKGNRSLTFTMAKIQAPAESPIWQGRMTEITNRITFFVRKDAATPTEALSVTNDNTP